MSHDNTLALIAEALAYGVRLTWEPNRLLLRAAGSHPLPDELVVEINDAAHDIWRLLAENARGPREEA